PEFLLLYILLCACVVGFAAWFVRSKDTSGEAGAEPIGKDLDPYEIAYLRGGSNEVVRYIAFELVHAGLLEVVPAAKKRQPATIARTASPPGTLSPLAKIVYDFFETPHTAEQLFSSTVPKLVDTACAPIHDELVARTLLAGDAANAAARTVRLNGSLIIV